MKEALLKIDELLNKEFKAKDDAYINFDDVPGNIREIYGIIAEELDYIERMEVK